MNERKGKKEKGKKKKKGGRERRKKPTSIKFPTYSWTKEEIV